MEGPDLLFKVDSERQIFCATFSWQFFFTLRIFGRNLLRWIRRRNTFRISFWCLAWDSNPGFSSNKRTHYLIDHGDLWCFLFYQKMCTLFQKIQLRVCFLKMFRPLRGWYEFILNNLHLPMQEGIPFYALYKSRVLIIPCKADGFCLFIGLPDEI